MEMYNEDTSKAVLKLSFQVLNRVQQALNIFDYRFDHLTLMLYDNISLFDCTHDNATGKRVQTQQIHLLGLQFVLLVHYLSRVQGRWP